MQRRQFVKYVGLGLTAAGAATLPSLGWASRASSREMPSIEWHAARSTSSAIQSNSAFSYAANIER